MALKVLEDSEGVLVSVHMLSPVIVDHQVLHVPVVLSYMLQNLFPCELGVLQNKNDVVHVHEIFSKAIANLFKHLHLMTLYQFVAM